jgi:hypothetical protein
VRFRRTRLRALLETPLVTIEARWITSTLASGLYAAERLLAGVEPVDRRTVDALAGEAADLASDLEAVGIERRRFFEHAIPLAARAHSPPQLVQVVLAKVLGPRYVGGGAERLGRRLASLAGAVDRAWPELLEQLELRSRPLAEQWEARGAGLLTTVRRLSAEDVVVEGAEVILVQPLAGGGGAAFALYNAIGFEALLANPISELPEVARLAWLWVQLNLDLPRYEEPVGRAAMARVGPLAVLPLVLAAAEEVELVKFDRGLVETALVAWGAPAARAETLADWWETYRTSDISWTASLVALANMLDER